MENMLILAATPLKNQGYSGSMNPNNPLFFIIFIEHYKR